MTGTVERLFGTFSKMELPPLGIGTAHIGPKDMSDVLRNALLEANVRHIDCAKVYGNEDSVGLALKSIFDSGRVKRDDVFITSKLWNDDHNNVEQACRLSLERLVSLLLNISKIDFETN